MTGKPRALYICPVTQGAMVAAAPWLAVDSYEITKVLLLQGVADPEHPTSFEWSEAIRPARGIAMFFERHGVEVVTKNAPSDDDAAWRKIVASVLTAEFLAQTDLILFNAQAGTKQMFVRGLGFFGRAFFGTRGTKSTCEAPLRAAGRSGATANRRTGETAFGTVV